MLYPYNQHPSWPTDECWVPGSDPKVIHVPNGVSWDSADRAIKDLRFWHRGWKEETHAGQQTPAKRRSKRQVKKPASGGVPSSSVTGQPVNKNGKRPASDEDSTRSTKRKRVAKADAMEAMGEAGQPRRSLRTRKERPEASASMPSSSAALLPNDPAAMAVDAEPTEAVEDATVDVIEAPQDPPVAKSPRKPRRKTGATRKAAAKRKGRGSRKAPARDVPSGTSTPSTPSSGTIRIPPRSAPSSPISATRGLEDGAPVLTWDETTPVASPASSCNATVAAPSSGGTTRVGTPQPDFKSKAGR